MPAHPEPPPLETPPAPASLPDAPPSEGPTLPADLPRAAGGPPPAFVGRFRVEREVGRGGMGAVLKAHDPTLDRPVAVKVLREDLCDDPTFARRFLEEAKVGGQLQDPGLAPVYEVGSIDGRPFFAMKPVKGRTLAELQADRADPSDDLPRFLVVFEQVCQAVAYAHSRGGCYTGTSSRRTSWWASSAKCRSWTGGWRRC